MSDLAHDGSYTIDPDTLREIPNNPDEMRELLQHHRQQAEDDAIDLIERTQSAGLAGTYARILRELDLAVKLFTGAITLADAADNDRLGYINRIRLAHAYQWQGEFEKSNAIFTKLLANPMQSYEDFVLQHAGKNAFDQQDYELALDYFQKALVLREANGNDELINSTKLAITATKRRLQNVGE